MKKLIFLLLIIFTSLTIFAQTKTQNWVADANHSSVNFSVKHLGISLVNGKFDKYEGAIELDNENINEAVFNFVIDVKSINTSLQTRDNHLKGTDFFSADQYPKIIFKQSAIKRIKADKYLLTGNLTIKDVTKPVIFYLTYGGKAKNDGYGNEKIGFQATTKINRLDFNITYDNTAVMIANSIDLTINLQFAKQK